MPTISFPAHAYLPEMGQPEIEVDDPFVRLESEWEEVKQLISRIPFTDAEEKLYKKCAKQQPPLAGYPLTCSIIRKIIHKRLMLQKFISSIQFEHQNALSIISDENYHVDRSMGKLMAIGNEIREEYVRTKEKLYDQLLEFRNTLARETPCSILHPHRIIYFDDTRTELAKEELSLKEIILVNPADYISVDKNKLQPDIVLNTEKEIEDVDSIVDLFYAYKNILANHKKISGSLFEKFKAPVSWGSIYRITELHHLKELIEIHEYIESKIDKKFTFGITHIELPTYTTLDEDTIKFIMSLPELRSIKIPNPGINQELFDKFFKDIKADEILSLDLSDNSYINNDNAENIFKFRKLQVINLSGCIGIKPRIWNQIIDLLPDTVINLNLSNNILDDDSIIKITQKKFPSLRTLNLSFQNHFPTNKWLQFIKQLPLSITELYLENTAIGEQAASLISNFPKLKKLSLSKCKKISADHWKSIISILPSTLEYVDISTTFADDNAIPELYKLKFLSTVNAHACPISVRSKSIVEQINRREELTTFRESIQLNSIGSKIPEDAKQNADSIIQYIQDMVSARINDYDIFTKEEIWSNIRIERIDQIEKIALLERDIRLLVHNNFQFGITHIILKHQMLSLTPIILDFISRKSRTLRVLSLRDITNTPEEITSILIGLQGSKNLTTISLRNTCADDDIVNPLLTLPAINSLSLQDSKGISAQALADLLELLPKHMEKLNLCLTNIDDAGAKFLNQYHQLKKIDLDSCTKISQGVIDELVVNLPENVEKLTLSGSNISEIGFESIQRFQNLKKTSFCGFEGISGTLTNKVIRTLPEKLEELVLSGTSVEEGAIRISELPNLKHIHLLFCLSIPENIMDEIVKKIPENIETLRLMGVCIRQGAEGIGRLSNLKNLILSSCPLIPQVTMDTIANNLPDSIEHLDISNTDIGAGAEGITKLQQLKHLNLSHCINIPEKVMNEIVSSLPVTTETLALWNTRIGTGAKGICHLPELKHLDLFNCGNIPTKAMDQIIGSLPIAMKSLNLGRTKIGKGAKRITKLSKLELLNLSNCTNIPRHTLNEIGTMLPETMLELTLSRVTIDSGAKGIADLPILQTLVLDNCTGIPRDVMDYIVVTLPLTIEVLNLDGTAIGVGATRIAELPKLKSLTLANTRIPQNIMNIIGRALPETVEELDFEKTAISSGAEGIARLPKLKKLDLTNCTNISEEVLNHLVMDLPNTVEVLRLSNTNLGLGVMGIVNLNKLKLLELAYCKEIPPGFIDLTVAAFPVSLELLNLEFTNLSSSGARTLKRLQRLQVLKILNVNVSSSAIKDIKKELPSTRVDGSVCSIQ